MELVRLPLRRTPFCPSVLFGREQLTLVRSAPHISRRHAHVRDVGIGVSVPGVVPSLGLSGRNAYVQSNLVIGPDSLLRVARAVAASSWDSSLRNMVPGQVFSSTFKKEKTCEEEVRHVVAEESDGNATPVAPQQSRQKFFVPQKYIGTLNRTL